MTRCPEVFPYCQLRNRDGQVKAFSYPEPTLSQPGLTWPYPVLETSQLDPVLPYWRQKIPCPASNLSYECYVLLLPCLVKVMSLSCPVNAFSFRCHPQLANDNLTLLITVAIESGYHSILLLYFDNESHHIFLKFRWLFVESLVWSSEEFIFSSLQLSLWKICWTWYTSL